MKIHLSSTCGNSPKNKLLENYTVKLFSFDFTELVEMSVEDIKLLIPDRALIQGKSNLLNFQKYFKIDIQTLTVESSISHGKYGAVLCEISDNEKDYKISVHYMFENMKATLIKEATVLIVEKKLAFKDKI